MSGSIDNFLNYIEQPDHPAGKPSDAASLLNEYDNEGDDEFTDLNWYQNWIGDVKQPVDAAVPPQTSTVIKNVSGGEVRDVDPIFPQSLS